MYAISLGHFQSVKMLCKENSSVKLLNIVDKNGRNALDIATFEGNTRILKFLISTLLERCNVNSWDNLRSKLNFGTILQQLIKICQSKHHHSTLQFLNRLYSQAYLKHNFILFCVMLDNGNLENIAKEKIYDNSVQLRKDLKIAQTLRRYCDQENKDIGKRLANIINKMIENKECINDSLLLFAKQYDEDNDTTMKNLESTLSNVLSINENNLGMSVSIGGNNIDKNRNARDAAWYSECILKSNIFALDKGKSFDSIKKNVINKQIAKQAKYLANQINLISKEMKESWQLLTNIEDESFAAIIQQNCIYDKYHNENYMLKNGVQVRYKETELNNDVLTGFNTRAAYDNNVIATELLIMSSKLNVQFQKDCQKIFDSISKIHQIPCYYKEAPIKTLERYV